MTKEKLTSSGKKSKRELKESDALNKLTEACKIARSFGAKSIKIDGIEIEFFTDRSFGAGPIEPVKPSEEEKKQEDLAKKFFDLQNKNSLADGGYSVQEN